MTSSDNTERLIGVAKQYFEEVDQGQLPLQLFRSDFSFYFPKYGIGQGADEFREFGGGLWKAGYKAQHHREQLKYTAAGKTVVVEGTTQGSDGAGRTWNGGVTPGGRFLNIFEFDDEGLIERMFIYLDPDYTSLDQGRFHWTRANEKW